MTRTSKITNVWLSLSETVEFLSKPGEELTEADVLRLVLDGRLRSSIRFHNHTQARCGNVIQYSEAQLAAEFTAGELPNGFKWGTFSVLPGKPTATLEDEYVYVEQYLNLGDEIMTLSGVWDLSMCGSGGLEIEKEYQRLTGGPSVTRICLGGILVEGDDGMFCILQDTFGPDYVEVSEGIRRNPLSYFPASSLPPDCELVFRLDALQSYVNEIVDTSPLADRAHVSNNLAKINQAAARFWANADRNDRGTHPDNATVTAWLIQQGLSKTLAEKAATIIRPNWAPTGRKPEE